jgi:hypothetical protein
LQKKTKSKGDFVPAISNLSDKEIGYSARKIIDKDGDGVEDNVHLTHAELERYRVPHVFGTVEEMHNTHNGELPGHIRYGEDNLPGRHASHLFVDPYEKERNASKYPMPTQGGENSKAAADADAKDKAEAAKDEKKNAEPEPKKEGLTEEAKEAKPEEEKKEEAAANLRKRRLKKLLLRKRPLLIPLRRLLPHLLRFPRKHPLLMLPTTSKKLPRKRPRLMVKRLRRQLLPSKRKKPLLRRLPRPLKRPRKLNLQRRPSSNSEILKVSPTTTSSVPPNSGTPRMAMSSKRRMISPSPPINLFNSSTTSKALRISSILVSRPSFLPLSPTTSLRNGCLSKTPTLVMTVLLENLSPLLRISSKPET